LITGRGKRKGKQLAAILKKKQNTEKLYQLNKQQNGNVGPWTLEQETGGKTFVKSTQRGQTKKVWREGNGSVCPRSKRNGTAVLDNGKRKGKKKKKKKKTT